jgi:hypothetical protein
VLTATAVRARGPRLVSASRAARRPAAKARRVSKVPAATCHARPAAASYDKLTPSICSMTCSNSCARQLAVVAAEAHVDVGVERAARTAPDRRLRASAADAVHDRDAHAHTAVGGDTRALPPERV